MYGLASLRSACVAAAFICAALALPAGSTDAQGPEHADQAVSQDSPSAALKAQYPEVFEKKAIVGFGADWCSACKYQKPANLNLRNAGYRFLYYDWDKDAALRKHFRVTKIPVTIISDRGNVVERFVGVTAWTRIRDAAGDDYKIKDQPEPEPDDAEPVFPRLRRLIDNIRSLW